MLEMQTLRRTQRPPRRGALPGLSTAAKTVATTASPLCACAPPPHVLVDVVSPEGRRRGVTPKRSSCRQTLSSSRHRCAPTLWAIYKDITRQCLSSFHIMSPVKTLSQHRHVNVVIAAAHQSASNAFSSHVPLRHLAFLPRIPCPQVAQSEDA